MDKDALRIPTTMQRADLWVDPGQCVSGSIFLHLETRRHAGQERPEDVLNEPEPFLVFRTDPPNELRLYCKRRITLMQYLDEQPSNEMAGRTILGCRLLLADGVMVAGSIREFLPPERPRLFDYLNNCSESFIRLHLEAGMVGLINKEHIIYASAVRDAFV
ncbi:MAG: hypothetical protein H0V34_01745 [Gammaproteobacteria bacterium]|nr:hypothetical protein [Gammaproteobacteria bacterium]